MEIQLKKGESIKVLQQEGNVSWIIAKIRITKKGEAYINKRMMNK